MKSHSTNYELILILMNTYFISSIIFNTFQLVEQFSFRSNIIDSKGKFKNHIINSRFYKPKILIGLNDFKLIF